MNWNRRKALPVWEKRRIRNRHERKLRKERVFAYKLAIGMAIAAGFGFIAGEFTAISMLL